MIGTADWPLKAHDVMARINAYWETGMLFLPEIFYPIHSNPNLIFDSLH